MSIEELLKDLESLGIRLRTEGDRLVIKAPRDVVTAEVRETLKDRKKEIVEFLANRLEASRPPPLVPIDRNQKLPLSYAQQRMWYLDQLQQDAGSVYTIASAFRFSELLDVALLRRAINALVERHEVLRTRFVMSGEAPVQIIEPKGKTELELVDLASCDEKEFLESLHEQAGRSFSLEQGEMFRAVYFKINESESALLIAVHHAVCDGWSTKLIIDELAELYSSELSEREPDLVSLPVQYADYAQWQREWLARGEMERQLSYWREELADNNDPLQLPTDRTRPKVQTFNGNFLRQEIELAPIKRVLEQERGSGVSLFMLLLSALNIVLARNSSQNQVTLGTPVANRSQPEVAGLIGLFVNTLALRVDLSGNPTLQELIVRVRDVCLDAYENQELPFERLVEELHPPHELSRPPIFQAMVSFLSDDVGVPTFGGATTSAIELTGKTSRFDVSFFVIQKATTLDFLIEYNTDLFDESTIQNLMTQLKVLLTNMDKLGETPIHAIDLLDNASKEKITHKWNATDAPMPAQPSLNALLQSKVIEYKDNIAVVFDDHALSYQQLEEQSNQLAHYLRSLGAGRGSVVGLYQNRSQDTLVCLLAILKTGAAYLPLDPHFPAERISYMLADSKAQLVITNSALCNNLEEGSWQSVLMDKVAQAVAQMPTTPFDSHGSGDDLAYLLYTSGSTGKPKGVMVQHQAVINFLQSMSKVPGLRSEDTLLAVTTTSFDISVLELFLPLLVGATVVIASRESSADGNSLISLIEQSNTNVMQATPATWRLLIESGWTGNPDFKVLCGGEPFPQDLAQQLLARAGEVWNMYGPTETTVWSTCCQVITENDIHVGTPIDNTQTYILNEAGLVQPIGVAGELHIGGLGVTKGYHNREELTALNFVRDPFTKKNTQFYKTGDLARLREDGQIEHLGRMDSQVKVRGFRIELGEIEFVLASLTGIAEAAVIVWEASPGDQRLISFLVMAANEELNIAEVRKALRAQLPDYMIPQRFVTLDELPLTPNGKVDRKSLTPPSDSKVQVEEKSAPVTEAEIGIAGVWKDLIGSDFIGRDDNFFAAGGHSLLAVRASVRMEQELGIRVSASMLVLETLAQIAENTREQKLSPLQQVIGRVRWLFTRKEKQVSG